MDFTSEFHTHPEINQPIKIVMGRNYELLKIEPKAMIVTVEIDFYNTDKTSIITTQKYSYKDDEERREAWCNTELQYLIDNVYTTLGEAIIDSIYKTVKLRLGINDTI